MQQQQDQQSEQEQLTLYGAQARAMNQLLARDPLIVKMTDDELIMMTDTDTQNNEHTTLLCSRYGGNLTAVIGGSATSVALSEAALDDLAATLLQWKEWRARSDAHPVAEEPVDLSDLDDHPF